MARTSKATASKATQSDSKGEQNRSNVQADGTLAFGIVAGAMGLTIALLENEKAAASENSVSVPVAANDATAGHSVGAQSAHQVTAHDGGQVTEAQAATVASVEPGDLAVDSPSIASTPVDQPPATGEEPVAAEHSEATSGGVVNGSSDAAAETAQVDDQTAVASLAPSEVESGGTSANSSDPAPTLTDALDAPPLTHILDPVLDPLQPVTGVVEPILEVLTPVPELVSPIVDVLEPVTNILNPVIDLLDPVVDIVSPVLGVLEPVTDILDPVVGIVSPILGGILEPVTDVLDPVVDIVSPILGGILEPVTDVLDPVVDIVSPVLGGVLEPVTNLLEPVTDVLDPVVDIVSPVLGGVLEPVTNLLEPVTDVLDPVVEIARPILDVLGPLANIIDPESLLGGLTTASGETATEPLSGVAESLLGGGLGGVLGLTDGILSIVVPTLGFIGQPIFETNDGHKPADSNGTLMHA